MILLNIIVKCKQWLFVFLGFYGSIDTFKVISVVVNSGYKVLVAMWINKIYYFSVSAKSCLVKDIMFVCLHLLEKIDLLKEWLPNNTFANHWSLSVAYIYLKTGMSNFKFFLFFSGFFFKMKNIIFR